MARTMETGESSNSNSSSQPSTSIDGKNRSSVPNQASHPENEMNILWTVNSNGIFTLLEGNSISELDIDIKQFIGHSVFDLFKSVPSIIDAIHRGFAGERVYTSIELVGLRWDLNCYPLRDNNSNVSGLVGVARAMALPDRPSIKREKILSLQNALKISLTIPDMLEIIQNEMVELLQPAGLIIATATNWGLIVESSHGIWETYNGMTLSPINVHDPIRIYPQSQVPDVLKNKGEFWITGFPLVTREKNIGSLWVAFDDPISESNVQLLLSICDIVAEALKRGKQFEQTQLRLQQLAVLHDIDSAILGNASLITIFDIALSHLMEQLNVHAAAVLLLNSSSGRLECVHGQGIQSLDFYKTSLLLEECLSGQFSIHNRSIDIFNVFECQKTCKRADFLINRGFMVCYGVPLTIQGEIIGVIEIFNQQILDLGKSRVAFLEIIATKIAKAIINTGLFADLFGSQINLPVTDQNNLEGLSHALNLQDKETEAHSQRAAKMTVLIAKSMGIQENRLERIQRGSLLHDIETIINKPGPLSEDEWEVVRRHPVYAYNLIKPVSYLQSSIDIPYCHHEKWDGTGYPQGLKGEQIPIAARIFAVTDVWDALRSNRPYRSAWTANQARNYILQQSGKHFDPQVVEKFFELALDKTN